VQCARLPGHQLCLLRSFSIWAAHVRSICCCYKTSLRSRCLAMVTERWMKRSRCLIADPLHARKSSMTACTLCRLPHALRVRTPCARDGITPPPRICAGCGMKTVLCCSCACTLAVCHLASRHEQWRGGGNGVLERILMKRRNGVVAWQPSDRRMVLHRTTTLPLLQPPPCPHAHAHLRTCCLRSSH